MTPRSFIARLGSPQVLLAVLALIAAIVFAWSAGRDVPAPPVILTGDEVTDASRVTQVVLYVVQDGIANPVVREVAAPTGRAEALQALVDALRSDLVTLSVWPATLPTPRVYLTTVERRDGVVLDLVGRATPPLDVQAERTILASLERTLLEADVDTVTYLRDGAPVEAWLGRIATPPNLP